MIQRVIALLRVGIRVTLDETVQKSGDDFGTAETFLFADVLKRLHDVGRDASGDALQPIAFVVTLAGFFRHPLLFPIQLHRFVTLRLDSGVLEVVFVFLFGLRDIAVRSYGGRLDDLVEGEQFVAHQSPPVFSLGGRLLGLHLLFVFGFLLRRCGRTATRREGFRVHPPRPTVGSCSRAILFLHCSFERRFDEFTYSIAFACSKRLYLHVELVVFVYPRKATPSQRSVFRSAFSDSL